MERGQIGQQNPIPYRVLPDRIEELHANRHLRYAGKLFPVNALVTLLGREGIFRIVSEPYILPGYTYPHFDVEAAGHRLSVSVITATRIYES